MKMIHPTRKMPMIQKNWKTSDRKVIPKIQKTAATPLAGKKRQVEGRQICGRK